MVAYSPLLIKYQELWAKYSTPLQKPAPQNCLPKISSQEEAIKYSIKLKEALHSAAKELNLKYSCVLDSFIKGAETASQAKLKTGLANIHASIDVDKLIRAFELFFDFDSLDDIFFDKGEKTSVYIE